MIPSIGRIVHFRLAQYHVDEIQRLREASAAIAKAPNGSKVVVHHRHGNGARAGDVYPMLITRVWDATPHEGSCVQGQVFLDGNDSLWVTSATQAGHAFGVPMESAEPDANVTVDGSWADPMDPEAWDRALDKYRDRLAEMRAESARKEEPEQ